MPINHVIHIDPDFLIVDKPAGLATCPNSNVGATPTKTLTESISSHYPEILSLPDQGAVHRLDNDTSGLVVIARNKKTWTAFRELFSRDRVQKEYLALVWGNVVEKGRIDLPIGNNPKSAKRVKVYFGKKEAIRQKAQSATTFYEPITLTPIPLRFATGTASLALSHQGRGRIVSLLKVRIKTGRRHQIRAHLAAIGFPIVGDKIYHSKTSPKTSPVPRHLLHAWRLTFSHPASGQKVSFEAPIPPDLQKNRT